MDYLDKSLVSRSPNTSYSNISHNEGNNEIPPVKLQGYIYSWGKNKDGELSIGHNKNCNIPNPSKGLTDKIVKFINSGGAHTGIVTEEGQLLVSGSSLHGIWFKFFKFHIFIGKLGIEELTMVNINKVQPVNALKGLVVKQVACGDYHTLCLLGI